MNKGIPVFLAALFGILLFGCIGGGTTTPTATPTIKPTVAPTEPAGLSDSDLDTSDADTIDSLGDDISGGDEIEIDEDIEG